MADSLNCRTIVRCVRHEGVPTHRMLSETSLLNVFRYDFDIILKRNLSSQGPIASKCPTTPGRSRRPMLVGEDVIRTVYLATLLLLSSKTLESIPSDKTTLTI
ncbi:hypothetical protein AVEN_11177-1 [Araneus ventricosus]|uniref:Uncharacterized protein n=1 Tax=Araneus ventricosus TaxID=182803 RepID=A0A4Y2TD50_ARAVE|nr:hypothetical protein AVEN_11177-1 [Araneus ventricosus]